MVVTYEIIGRSNGLIVFGVMKMRMSYAPFTGAICRPGKLIDDKFTIPAYLILKAY